MSSSFNPQESHRLTAPPNPNFKAGSKPPWGSQLSEDWIRTAEESGFTTIDPGNHEPSVIYRLLIGGVIPRPIAFVSSLSANGAANLAPFSYFNVVSHNPPMISVSFSHSATRHKDTCLNIKATKTFTVNIISEPFVEAANWCSVDAPHGVGEWYGSGLTKEKSTLVEPARVKESAFSMECELYQAIDLRPVGASENSPITGTLVLGSIKLIHVRNDVLVQPGSIAPPVQGNPSDRPREFSIDATKLRAVSRMGGITYGRIGEGFQIPRPSWSNVRDIYEGSEESKTG